MQEHDPQVEETLHRSRRTMPKFRTITKALLILLVAVIVGAASYSTYVWQHSQLISSDSHVGQLNNDVKKLKTQVSDLQTKNKQLQSVVTASQNTNYVTETDLAISVDSTTYNAQPSCQAITSTPAFAAIDMVISNPTKTPIYLVPNTLKLKDANNNVYLGVGNSFTNPSCIAGYKYLADQTIAPGETIRGALVFQVPSSSIHSFKLVNGTRTYTVNVQ